MTRRTAFAVAGQALGGAAGIGRPAARRRLRHGADLRAPEGDLAGGRRSGRVHRRHLPPGGDHDRRRHRRRRQEHRLHPQGQRRAERERPTPSSRSRPAARTSAARSASSRPPATSSARATAASTTSRARSSAARPVRPLDRFQTRVRGRQARDRPALQRHLAARARPGTRSRRVHRWNLGVPLPAAAIDRAGAVIGTRSNDEDSRIPDPAASSQARQAGRAQNGNRNGNGNGNGNGEGRDAERPRQDQGRRGRPGRLGRRAHRRHPVPHGDAASQGPEGHELVLHARLGDPVRLHHAGDHRAYSWRCTTRRRRPRPTHRSPT